jgi:hypothetical protein
MTPVVTPPLFAAFDLVHLAMAMVVAFILIMKHLFNMNQEASKKREGAPQPQPGAPQARPAGGQQADALRSQVEEFLRRAGRPVPANQPTQRPPQPRPASEIELLVVENASPSERPLGESLRATRTSPAGADKQRTSRRSKQRQSVAEHVAERVASRSQTLAEKTAQLGRRIVNEDQQFDSQLKAKFDHAVGTLAGNVATPAEQSAPPVADTPARQIAAMLANPDGVRQAVLVNEILRRPSDRW